MSSAAAAQPAGMVPACTRCGLFHQLGAACPVPSTLPIRTAGHELAAGNVVAGRFAVENVAHRSGMSTIYLAGRLDADPRYDDVRVVVKQVSVAGLPEADRVEISKWLAREAGLLSSLKNPHLPTLIAAFSEGDNHYVVMPYLSGETLKERVQRQGPQPEACVLRWAFELVEVLAYLHAQAPPVIHRDIKPDNMLIGQRQRPRFHSADFDPSSPDYKQGEILILLDLGVARAQPRGLPGTAVGTPGYAPPEQYQGLADERSDLYALGATLHYLLTGYDAEQQAPFRHPPVPDLAPEVSPALAQLVEDLLQLAPTQRPDGAQEVRDRLQAILREVWSPRFRDSAKAMQLYIGAAQTCWPLMAFADGLANARLAGHSPGAYTMILGAFLLFCMGIFVFSALSVKSSEILAKQARLRAIAVVFPLWIIPVPLALFAPAAVETPLAAAMSISSMLLASAPLWVWGFKTGAGYKELDRFIEANGLSALK